MRVHERVHNDDNNTGCTETTYECQVCNKPFTRKGDLILHERVHSVVKPYACGACSKSFVSSSHLRVYERIHTGNKPDKSHECHICLKHFRRRGDLNVHMGNFT